MLKSLFTALTVAAAGLAVLQPGPDRGAGNEPAGSAAGAGMPAAPSALDAGAGRAAAQLSGPARDARPRVKVPADGGLTYLGDAPGRTLAPDDGGPGSGSADAADARPAGGGPPADELQQLRSRVAALEQQLAQARADSQIQLLRQINEQVAALRDQLAEEQERRQAQEVATQEARARAQEAVAALFAAQRQLALGNSQVLDTLDSASPALPAPAQLAVQNARAQVQSGDLAGARYWLSIAIAQTQRQQLSY